MKGKKHKRIMHTMREFDRQVKAALKKYPTVGHKELLVEMATGDGRKSVETLAKELSLKNIPKKKILLKPPRTFAEADAQISRLYGNEESQNVERVGWICPRCDTVNSPYQKTCLHCEEGSL